jgi:hypothetical protein
VSQILYNIDILNDTKTNKAKGHTDLTLQNPQVLRNQKQLLTMLIDLNSSALTD